MPRPNVSLTISGVRFFENYTLGTSAQAVVPKQMFTENTSGVSRHKPRGWIPPTAYRVSQSNRNGASGIVDYRKVTPVGVFGYRYSGIVGQTNNSGPVNFQGICNVAMLENVAFDVSGLVNRALISARTNLKDMKIDLGTAFGERNQTANLIGDTASRLAKAVRNLRSGKIRNAMRDLGVSSSKNAPRGSNWTNNWLELQYGWKPLLSDIYGACDALSKRGTDDWSVVARGSAQEDISGFARRFPTDADPVGYLCTARAERGAFVRIDAAVSNSFIGSLASLGVTNPLNVAWELVPYSFVVDWFLPIGSWISSLDATLGFTIRGCSISTRTVANWGLSGLSGLTSAGYYATNSWSGTKRVFLLDRTVNGSVPIPHFPSFKDPRSLGHMANGLSLLAQAFRR